MTGEFTQRDETVLKGPTRTEFDFGYFDHQNIPLEEEQYPVIVIGSSIVGMSLSILLGYYGVKSISFDRHPSTATHPRAALFLLRTMEIFRQLGLDGEMNRASASDFDLDAGMLIVEQLIGGKVIARMQEADPTQTAKITPCKRLWLTQNMFEPLLRREAHRFGANQRFATRIVHYEEQDDGVIVIAQNTETGHYSKYKTQYLVACDGNRSPTRRKEQIGWNGPGIFGNNLSINFRADLVPFLGSRAVHGVTYVNNKDVSAGFRLENGGKRGFMIVSRLEERDDFEPDSITEQEAKRAFYFASGLQESDIALEIESVSYWSVAALNSERYSTEKRRVFLAGDAAHIMPPTGGMGGNTGILDAYNLAWKLAYVIQGNASSSLLESYNTERQPAAGKTMQQAFARLVNRVLRDESIDHDKELPDDICELGYRYPDGAFVYGERSNLEVWEDPYHPSALPGARMPHISLMDRNREGDGISTIDLLKSNFVLLVSGSHPTWCAAVSKQRLHIDVYEISESSSPVYDPTGRFREVYKLDVEEGILIRPDGLIAWRGIARSEKIKTASLQSVLKQILGM